MPELSHEVTANTSLQLDHEIRSCKKCKGDMICQSRQVEIFGAVSHFSCLACGHKTSLKTGGVSGLHLAVEFLATGFLSFILWGSRGGYDLTNGLKTLAVLAVFTSPTWWGAIKTRQYPVTGLRAVIEDESVGLSEADMGPLQKGVAFMDKLSPYKTFLIVLMCVVIFLGAAALIGWINFTFFGDRLFG